MTTETALDPIALCRADELAEGGLAVPFDVEYEGENCRAFAIRFEGRAHAYLNRCTHVALELDWQPNRIFDDTGQWLLCAAHGAVYAPDTGAGVAGPCQGGLVKIALSEQGGMVYWHPTAILRPIAF
ncbi:MAG TPA: Rieske 2Fe-2S domain-containing protein [Ottowia sp.]|uniref:Rieske (2Fe-2S) protein n=1 Tax=Ottowia sp. TaxID=1898956 RepID=UPI002C2BC5C7|nr:Rieske 2Fe-2S domain-containing protein [Ottowia sp.]HMN21517.1 Rieske 2Fe-2S domain-containing protein [Ottowia sp.]